jgi:hypothetical protein
VAFESKAQLPVPEKIATRVASSSWSLGELRLSVAASCR